MRVSERERDSTHLSSSPPPSLHCHSVHSPMFTEIPSFFLKSRQEWKTILLQISVWPSNLRLSKLPLLILKHGFMERRKRKRRDILTNGLLSLSLSLTISCLSSFSRNLSLSYTVSSNTLTFTWLFVSEQVTGFQWHDKVENYTQRKHKQITQLNTKLLRQWYCHESVLSHTYTL